jgi:hypothetical protein
VWFFTHFPALRRCFVRESGPLLSIGVGDAHETGADRLTKAPLKSARPIKPSTIAASLPSRQTNKSDVIASHGVTEL